MKRRKEEREKQRGVWSGKKKKEEEGGMGQRREGEGKRDVEEGLQKYPLRACQEAVKRSNELE